MSLAMMELCIQFIQFLRYRTNTVSVTYFRLKLILFVQYWANTVSVWYFIYEVNIGLTALDQYMFDDEYMYIVYTVFTASSQYGFSNLFRLKLILFVKYWANTVSLWYFIYDIGIGFIAVYLMT